DIAGIRESVTLHVQYADTSHAGAKPKVAVFHLLDVHHCSGEQGVFIFFFMLEYGELLGIWMKEGRSFVGSYPYVFVVFDTDGINFITGNTVRIVRVVPIVGESLFLEVDDTESVDHMAYVKISLSIISGRPISSWQS